MCAARARLARPGSIVLLAALVVEFTDELFDGTKSAALPLIRHDLGLTYVQVGLLTAAPLLVGGLIELPLGVLGGTGRRRRRFILGGGLVFAGAIAAVAAATAFGPLVAALTIFFPASGAFVSLTQSSLMDAAPQRRAQHMARWTLAGSAGALAGPALLGGFLAAGLSWRAAILAVAVCALAALAGVAGTGARPAAGAGTAPRADCGAQADGAQADGARPDLGDQDTPDWPGWRRGLRLLTESGAVRWLTLLQVSDLLLDVLTAFLAVYLVADAGASAFAAAGGVAVRLGAGLAGDALLAWLLNRASPRRVLQASAWLAAGLYPAFLLVPGFGLKLVVLAALSLSTAAWYPVGQAELYGSLPGHSGFAVSLTSAAGLAGAAGPLTVGVLADRFGLGWGMAVLGLAPACVLALAGAGRRRLRAGHLG